MKVQTQKFAKKYRSKYFLLHKSNWKNESRYRFFSNGQKKSNLDSDSKYVFCILYLYFKYKYFKYPQCLSIILKQERSFHLGVEFDSTWVKGAPYP